MGKTRSRLGTTTAMSSSTYLLSRRIGYPSQLADALLSQESAETLLDSIPDPTTDEYDGMAFGPWQGNRYCLLGEIRRYTNSTPINTPKRLMRFLDRTQWMYNLEGIRNIKTLASTWQDDSLLDLTHCVDRIHLYSPRAAIAISLIQDRNNERVEALLHRTGCFELSEDDIIAAIEAVFYRR